MIESSIGRKAIVAVTGLGLFAFVIGHMLGNLQIFMGPDVLNGYAHKLKATPATLWTVRLGLLGFFVAHMAVALRLARSSSLSEGVRARSVLALLCRSRSPPIWDRLFSK